MIGRRRAERRELLAELGELRRANEVLERQAGEAARQAQLAAAESVQSKVRVRQLERDNGALLGSLNGYAQLVQALEHAQGPDEFRAIKAQVWPVPAAPVSLEGARARAAETAHALFGGDDDTIRFARPSDVYAAMNGGPA